MIVCFNREPLVKIVVEVLTYFAIVLFFFLGGGGGGGLFGGGPGVVCILYATFWF